MKKIKGELVLVVKGNEVVIENSDEASLVQVEKAY